MKKIRRATRPSGRPQQESELTLYLDPNYDPVFSYSVLEGWLLLYDRIYIANPSPHQVRKARRDRVMPLVSEASLQGLVRRKWVVPIGRPRFFTPDWRISRAKELKKLDASRSAHFAWTGKFDEVMREYALLLPDDGLDDAISAGISLDERHPEAFSEVASRVDLLRAEGLLPAKFYTPSESRKSLIDVTKGVLYEVAGDLWVRRQLGATGMVIPSEHELVYGMLDRAADGWSPLEPRISAALSQASDELSEQDVLLARELAERILHEYMIVDVLPEYRESSLQYQFRAFVLATMEQLRYQEKGLADSTALWARFQEQLDVIQKTEDLGGYLAGLGSAAISLHPDVQKLLQQGITRRAILMLALFQAGQFVGKPLLGPPVDSMRSAVFDTPDRWISLMARKAKKR